MNVWKRWLIVSVLSWSCFWAHEEAPPVFDEVPEVPAPAPLRELPVQADTLLAVKDSVPPVRLLVPVVEAGKKILALPANRDIRVEVSYPREDTLGFNIAPALRVQTRYELGRMNSDWYDLRCDNYDRNECDFFVADGGTAGLAQDTLTLRISRIVLNDPYLEATWFFRFRLEYQGKLSTWNEIGPVRLVGVNRLGVPRRPAVRLLP